MTKKFILRQNNTSFSTSIVISRFSFIGDDVVNALGVLNARAVGELDLDVSLEGGEEKASLGCTWEHYVITIEITQ